MTKSIYLEYWYILAYPKKMDSKEQKEIGFSLPADLPVPHFISLLPAFGSYEK
jgi:hypothetical protein